jgi:hypothetical protein
MLAAIRAGFVYFIVVFAVGFALGTLRYLVIIPAIGELAAVALELPVMLVVSWLACGAILRSFALPARLGVRLVMGVTAFSLVMAAEAALAVFGFGRTLAVYLQSYETSAGLLGLGGQLLFAALPLFMRTAISELQPSKE